MWDFTVNTDFAQVEADEQQVNLTRFNLFFPEKRDFFLENSGVFGFGLPDASSFGNGVGAGGIVFGGRQNGSQDVRLFFSRRIGLSDSGASLPILGGTRLTGREGRYSLGVLNIQQRESSGVPSTNFTALRMRRDILANSDIGAVLLDKEQVGPGYNRMAGVDANFRFGFLQVNGFVAKTVSPAVVGAPGNSVFGRGNINYQSRVWQFRTRFDAIGNQFDDEVGFVPRHGVNDEYGYVSRSIRAKWFPGWLRELRPHWQLDNFTRQVDHSLDTRQQDFHLPLFMQNGGFMEIGANTNVESIRTPFALNAARGAIVGVGRHEYNEYFITYAGNGAARFAPSVRYSAGSFYGGGTRYSYAFGPSIHVNEKLSGSLNVQINDITLPTISYVSTLATTRINYNFNTKVFLNALLQYTTDTHQLSSNIRFNIIHRPLSDFFFVYNEHRDEHSGLMQDRSLIAKLTYMVAM
jgi:hypothetical protein